MIAGALGGRDGAVAALGTGSFIGIARGADVRAVGGWGLQLSDQASAGWIGRAGLSATLEAVDGMQNMGPMAQAMLARWNDQVDAIVDFATTARPVDYGLLAPFVTAHGDNDPAAAAILQAAAAWIERALAALGHDDGLPLVMTAGLVLPCGHGWRMRGGSLRTRRVVHWMGRCCWRGVQHGIDRADRLRCA